MRNKRDQIVTAALRRYRTSGVSGTTLKDVADVSGVPLGNLYYYFKTRDELILAVLEECERELRTLLSHLALHPGRAWFTAYFDWLLADPEDAAHFGCPFGTLAAELRGLDDPAAGRAAQVVQLYLNALRAQTATLGLSEMLADDVFGSVQGAYMVAHTLNDPRFFVEGVQRLRTRLQM